VAVTNHLESVRIIRQALPAKKIVEKPKNSRQWVKADRKERYRIVTVFRRNEAERSSSHSGPKQPSDFTQGHTCNLGQQRL
jgi:hypothetical protein